MKVLHKKLFSEILCDPSVHLMGPLERGVQGGHFAFQFLIAKDA